LAVFWAFDAKVAICLTCLSAAFEAFRVEMICLRRAVERVV
jgi:hypothetical protein